MQFSSLFKFLLIVLPTVVFGNQTEFKKNSSLLPCVKQLSANVCNKIGQMLIVGFGGLSQTENGEIIWQDPNSTVFMPNSNIAKYIKDQHIGGVILFTQPFRHNGTNEFIRDRNIQNSQQVVKLIDAMQAFNSQVRRKEGLPDLPLLISVDQEGGMVDRLPTTLGFPQSTVIPQALGADEESVLTQSKLKQKSLENTHDYAVKMANILFANHFNVNFAPCVDVNINPLNPVIGAKGRSFSANPDVVSNQAMQFVEAFHSKKILATLKHFPGHGSSKGDSHEGLVDVTDTYQKNKELLPYLHLIGLGFQDLIMSSHVINGQFDKSQCKPGPINDRSTWCPATMSYATLTELLRKKLNFKGVIVSDDMTMGAIKNVYSLEVAFEKAINAGVDMFIIANNNGNETERAVNTIAKLVKEGKVSQSQIDRAYQHIIKLKRRIRDE